MLIRIEKSNIIGLKEKELSFSDNYNSLEFYKEMNKKYHTLINKFIHNFFYTIAFISIYNRRTN